MFTKIALLGKCLFAFCAHERFRPDMSSNVFSQVLYFCRSMVAAFALEIFEEEMQIHVISYVPFPTAIQPCVTLVARDKCVVASFGVFFLAFVLSQVAVLVESLPAFLASYVFLVFVNLQMSLPDNFLNKSFFAGATAISSKKFSKMRQNVFLKVSNLNG